MSIFSAVLFDMDGTLVDSEPLWLANEISVMRKYGHEWSEADQRYCIGGPLSKASAYMVSLLKDAVTASVLENELVSGVARHMESGVKLFSGAHHLLLELLGKDIPRALVTASPRIIMNACLAGVIAQDSLLTDAFQATICLEDVTQAKPNPEGYHLAADRLGVPISECLVIEDSQTGVKAGLASGARVLAIPHFELGEDLLQDPRLRILDSLEDAHLATIEKLFS